MLIFFCLGRHGITFNGYSIICHMESKDTKQFMSNITDITRDEQNIIERKNVFGKIGTELYERADWESKCKRLFNKKFKALKIITNTPDMDAIMKTLSKLSSENNGRVLVFKNYDMVNHLVFLGYRKALLDKKLGTMSTKKDVTTYFAYIEQINVIFICHKIKVDNNVDQHMKNVTTSIAYFLTLYNKKIKSSEVRILGLLIQETETEKKHLTCRFCDLFSPTDKVFESPKSFNKWWDPIETYNNWWDFSKTTKCCNLFDDLAAQILGFTEAQKPSPSSFLDENILRNKKISNDHVDHIKLESPRYSSCKFSQSNNLPVKKINKANTSKESSTLSKKNVSKTDGSFKKINHRHYDGLDNRSPNGFQPQRQYSCEHKTHVKLENQNYTDAKNLRRNCYQVKKIPVKIIKKANTSREG